MGETRSFTRQGCSHPVQCSKCDHSVDERHVKLWGTLSQPGLQAGFPKANLFGAVWFNEQASERGAGQQLQWGRSN